MERSMRDLAARPDDLNFSYHPIDDRSGSTGHAAGLRRAFDAFDAMSVNVVCDADTVVLVPGWDTVTQGVLGDYDVLGNEYAPVGDPTTGHGLLQTYKGLPTFTWCAFRRGLLPDFDTAPDKARVLTVIDEEGHLTWGLPVGYSVFCDVGWRFPAWARERNLRCRVLKNTRLNAWPGCGDCNVSQELFIHGGAPFVAHQRSSMSLDCGEGHSADFYEAMRCTFRSGAIENIRKHD